TVVVVPQTVIYQDLAAAKLAADREAQLRATQQTAAVQNKLLKKRNQQLAEAQKQIVVEQKTFQKALDTVVSAQAKRDEAAYAEMLAKGKQLLKEKKYDAALAAFEGARRFKQTPEVQTQINITVTEQAVALAGKNDPKSNL